MPIAWGEAVRLPNSIAGVEFIAENGGVNMAVCWRAGGRNFLARTRFDDDLNAFRKRFFL
jgi:hypothetical protein